MRTVGIQIDTKSKRTKEKVYYYKTDKKYTEGENIRVKVPSGGTPIATVVKTNSKKKGNFKKLLEEDK